MSRSRGASASTLTPAMLTAPPEAVSKPAIMRRSVVLPQPDGPRSTQNSPSATSKEISLRISLAPKAFETLSTVSEAIAFSVVDAGPLLNLSPRRLRDPARCGAEKSTSAPPAAKSRWSKPPQSRPRHGVFAGEERDAHRQGLARRVCENDQRE